MFKIMTKKRIEELERKERVLHAMARDIRDTRVWCSHVSDVVPVVCDFLEDAFTSSGGCSVRGLREALEALTPSLRSVDSENLPRGLVLATDGGDYVLGEIVLEEGRPCVNLSSIECIYPTAYLDKKHLDKLYKALPARRGNG